jgi:ABC-2 type transport system ATP-binding protein
VLELHGLSKRYGDTVALDGLSFSVEPGQVFGFVGPNGAGKTTAMRIVLGLLRPDAGQVLWGGRPLDFEARRRVGYMPEERGLYPKMRLVDHLVYLAELHGFEPGTADAASRRWLERFGLADRGGDAVEKLSLGNQQRVQLAAALVHEPELLVLDEPFSGLDPVGVEVLGEALLDQARERGVPVVFSSHQLELVERVCDAVAIISTGRLVAAGEVGELRAGRARGRWHAELVDGDPAWDPGLPGVRRIGPWLFELQSEVDPQRLLEAVRQAGPVFRFGPHTPALSELYRDVTAAGERAEPER